MERGRKRESDMRGKYGGRRRKKLRNYKSWLKGKQKRI